MLTLTDHEKYEAMQGFRNMIDGLSTCSDAEIAGNLAMAHYMRIYLQANQLLPDDILSNPHPHSERWLKYINSIEIHLEKKIIKNQNHKFILSGISGVWQITLFAVAIEEFSNIGKELWNELLRGFPEAYSTWQRMAKEVSFFNYDFESDFHIKTIKEDIVTVPTALGLPLKQPTPSNDYLEKFEDILHLLRHLRHKMPMLLAVMHFVRINLIRLNEFPQQVWDDPHPSAFSLGQYTNAIKDYADNLPNSGDLSNIAKFCYDIWYYTVLGLMEPDKYKDKVQEIWNELSQGTNGAFEFWETKLYTPELYNLQSKIFIENMKEDIQRIPAALKNKIGFI